jgi:hypothetical protein
MNTPEMNGRRLSNEELALAPPRPISPEREAREAQAHYDLILLTTRRAARELESALSAGVTRERAAAVRKLVNSFAWANVALARAAAEVVRLHRLEDSDVIWEICL